MAAIVRAAFPPTQRVREKGWTYERKENESRPVGDGGMSRHRQIHVGVR